MSRTDKDLPYWVMTRTPAKGVSVSVWHNHFCFGRPIFRWRVKEDADGVPVVERTESVIGYDENCRPIVSVCEREVRERVLVAHFPEECVVDYGSPHNKRKLGVFTCEAYLENGAGVEVLLSHYPYSEDRFERQHRFERYMPVFDSGKPIPLLHGHTHSRSVLSDNPWEFHVGVDAHGFKLVNESVVIEWLASLPS